MSQHQIPNIEVYHYTDIEGITGILRDGEIKAYPTILYANMLGALGDAEIVRTTEPIIWLSTNQHMEMTTMMKTTMGKVSPIGIIYRIALPYGYAGDLGLGDYTEARAIPHAEWEWSIRTGAAVGSHYTTWRICPRDIPRADWLRVERLAGADESGFLWTPYLEVS
jgi:hypothetical protein